MSKEPPTAISQIEGFSYSLLETLETQEPVMTPILADWIVYISDSASKALNQALEKYQGNPAFASCMGKNTMAKFGVHLVRQSVGAKINLVANTTPLIRLLPPDFLRVMLNAMRWQNTRMNFTATPDPMAQFLKITSDLMPYARLSHEAKAPSFRSHRDGYVWVDKRAQEALQVITTEIDSFRQAA